MMFKSARFNTYLTVALLLLLLGPGCETTAKKKEDKETALLSLHLQTDQLDGPHIKHISVFRAAPIYLNVDEDPYVDSGNLVAAAVADDEGSYAIQIKFDMHGTILLDQMTSGNQTKRIAVYCKWDKESRWLSAKLINRRAFDGIYSFTPDASREEVERIVRGLNNVARKMIKQNKL